jgi:hypothetical protein
MSAFSRYIGIDYSGAETPEASLKGLRVYRAVGESAANEVPPPPSPRKYWTRRGIAHRLAARLAEDAPTIVGIDHGFSFPLRYFEVHQLAPDWPTFLEDFQRHWPTDAEHTYVDFVRDGAAGNGAARTGNARWRRVTEQRSGSAKSVFHFDVQGSVAKSTHAGIPWLLYLRGSSAAAFTSGHSTVGRSLRECLPSSRCTRRFGSKHFPRIIGRPTSMTLSRWRRGSEKPTAPGSLRGSCSRA